MNQERLEKQIKAIILKYADQISNPAEIVISNKFNPNTHGVTLFDQMVLEIIEFYKNQKIR